MRTCVARARAARLCGERRLGDVPRVRGHGAGHPRRAFAFAQVRAHYLPARTAPAGTAALEFHLRQ